MRTIPFIEYYLAEWQIVENGYRKEESNNAWQYCYDVSNLFSIQYINNPIVSYH